MTQPASFTFSLTSPTARYGPRLGKIALRRPGSTVDLQIPTPGLLTATSRGVVPHLSRDHHRLTDAIRWVNIPFETFLEHNPPVPTLQPGQNPLHTFLGFPPGKHLLSISARDPYDGREMPPNGKSHVSVYCLRGVRKLSPTDWSSYVLSCQPDVVFALSDIPFTDPPYSQKRLTKSIERSATWLSTILRSETRQNVFVQMAGGTCLPARKAFSDSLLERLDGPEADAIKPLTTLDEGVRGYTFDLVPLRQCLETQAKTSHTLSHHEIVPLIKTSLDPLSEQKIRLINSTESPHEILHYISHVGIDIFDARWAQRAADIGVALDFAFPVRSTGAQKDIGHCLYDTQYTLDFSPLADSFRGALSQGSTSPICPCAACSPVVPATRIYHGADTPVVLGEEPRKEAGTIYRPHVSRAYIHHLLHTHEMSAHALLVMHNLAVLDAFFAGVRKLISDAPERWEAEVLKFSEEYDESVTVFHQARASWREVELARGKGRLAREKEKKDAEGLATAA
ncbi:hypothetical protein M413DRAFT_22013 [Hebeloma cylindrosporum]|uniref:tRNA-guanine(15) transglycosylase-like domain-containing protein n=1 Tax=Hebeloma cylindrosporum TaxID=76867 RepID=A0A0C2Z9S8_HEBCY|nr:hypothetical protein M413DRAFT_22013 [Hebeloma cylindrosporum h7]